MRDFIQPVTKQRLSDGVVDQLKSLLAERNLRPGDKLPSERELSALFKVGRPSIREAIRTLDILGFVDIRPGQGIFVKEPNTDFYLKNLQDSVGMLMEMQQRTFIELLEVRVILETQTAFLAAVNARQKDLDLLDQAFEELEKAIIRYETTLRDEDMQTYINKDFAFHSAVAICSRNNVLHVMINFIEDLIKRSSRRFLSLPDLLKVSREFFAEHGKIREAIRSRSQAGAAEAMRSHLQHAREVMNRIIKTE